jgi:hypothetical protein
MQTLGLNAVGNLLGMVGAALVDRRYDLFLTRRFELIPDCLEVGRHLASAVMRAVSRLHALTTRDPCAPMRSRAL